mmetsp:Transcript_18542/g.21403  ORF Transcript_18542/g.21403 Transcript_18542/m.21403 type:complete len:684 (-) Transcript_18542:29-2080(-)
MIRLKSIIYTTLPFLVTSQNDQLPDWSILEQLLSDEASLHAISNSEYSTCLSLGTDAYQISAAANGICMHAPDCSHEFCHPDEFDYDLPSYTVDVRTEDDIARSLSFAIDNDIPVSVKTTGHSYTGSSTQRDSLMIWMHNYPKDGHITTDFEDSCGNVHDVVGISGGETIDDVLEAVKDDYHIVTGGGRTVGAAGGWLMGGGLSFTSREYGLGVDNVVDFRVVLADGSVVTADACTNSDLFWAMRGGGGGTFGVVTHVHYKVHPVTPIVAVNYFLLGLENLEEDDYPIFGNAIYQWWQFWIKYSPQLDSRWCGGFFGHLYTQLLFCGTLEEAQESFLGTFQFWYNNVLDTSKMVPGVWGSILYTETYNSWYEYRGGADAANNPDATDATGDAYDFIPDLHARLMPIDVVTSQPDELLLMMLKTVETSLNNIHYFLGGNINSVPTNETSVHPALRSSVWNVITTGGEVSQMVRDFIPNEVTGVCYNHHNVLEPEWRDACWGNNYLKLSELKSEFDPSHRFNCWHCVGYNGTEVPGKTTHVPTSSPTSADDISRFVLRYVKNDGEMVPVTETCKWLSTRPQDFIEKVCSSRRFQIYSEELGLASAANTCDEICSTYCVQQMASSKFIYGTQVNEDGEIVLLNKQCKWLIRQSVAKKEEICSGYVDVFNVYGQASDVCTEICDSCP